MLDHPIRIRHRPSLIRAACVLVALALLLPSALQAASGRWADAAPAQVGGSGVRADYDRSASGDGNGIPSHNQSPSLPDGTLQDEPLLSEAYRLAEVWRSSPDSLPPQSFFEPEGVAIDVDPFTAEIAVLVVDSGNDRVQIFDASGNYLRSLGGAEGEDASLSSPKGIALQGSLVFVADHGHDRVAVFTLDGQYVGAWDDLEGPWGIATSPAGSIAVTENAAGRITYFRADGSRSGQWGSFGEGVGQLNRPQGLTFLDDGRMVIADTGNQRLLLIEENGQQRDAQVMTSAPLDVAFHAASGEVWTTTLNDTILGFLPKQQTFEAQLGPNLIQTGMRGLALGRDAAGTTHLFTTFVDDLRPMHGVRHWEGNPPGDPADGIPEWGDIGIPLGRMDQPYRIAASPDGIWLVDRWPRAQRFDDAGVALDQVAAGRINDIVSDGDGLALGTDTELIRVAADGTERSRDQIAAEPMGYAWQVALATLPADESASIDLGGQRIWRRSQTIMEPAGRIGDPLGSRSGLWDITAGPAPDLAYTINRGADALEIRPLLRGNPDAEILPIDAVSVPGRPMRLDSNASGEIFVLNAYGWVLKYSANFSLLAAWDALPVGPERERSSPSDLTVDAKGRVLVADGGLNRITVFEADANGNPGTLPLFDPRCDSLGDKRADPTQLVLGEETTITLEIGGNCPEERSRADVVLVIDHSGSMGGGKLEAAQAAANTFIDNMDPDFDRVAVVSFNQAALLVATLNDSPLEAKAAVDAMVPGGGTNIAAGVDEARFELTGARRRLGAASVVILLTDGGSAEPPALRAADQAQLEGARLFTIGFGNGANNALLERMASSPEDYYFAPDDQALEAVYREIAIRIKANVLFSNLIITDELPLNMRYVEGSGSPEPSRTGQVLRWTLSDVPLNGTRLSYRVEPLETGTHPTNVVAVGEGTDGLGQRGRVAFPVPSVVVIAPTPTPPPFTATPTPSPTITPTPRPIYLPILRKDRCVRKVHVDVVLVLDTSNSMLDATSDGMSKLESAVDAASQFVDQLETGDQVAVAWFNGRSELATPLSSDMPAAKQNIATLPQAGGTRIELGLQSAGLALNGPGRILDNEALIVLLTDGRPNGVTEADVLAEARELHRSGASLYAIGLGDDVDAELLRQVASSPEQLLLAPDASDLEAVYETIARELPCDRP